LFTMREGDHCAVPANPGASGILPGMLPAAQVDGCSLAGYSRQLSQS
jgi:hypothetical protein